MEKDNPTVEQLKKELRIAELLNKVKKEGKNAKRN